jgi:hypothetical protein
MCCFYFEYYKDRPYFEYFGMNKFDVGPLVQLYNKMSKNKDGKVQVKTILKKFGIKRSLFMERAFSLLVRETYKLHDFHSLVEPTHFRVTCILFHIVFSASNALS